MIEEALEQATEEDRVHTSHGGTLLTIAGWGEAIETAQAHLDDARYLDAQYTASLPSDTGSVESALRSARETLGTALRERQSQLPPEPTADDWGPREELIHDLRWRVDDGRETVVAGVGPAAGVVDGTRLLATHGAIDRAQQRIDDGERFRVESAEAVMEYRQTALDALQTALAESSATPLSRAVLSDASYSVVSADWELGRLDGTVRPTRIDDAIVSYVIATTIARATPAAVDRAVEALGAA
ncbi:hypothetical protein ACFQL1_04050 [Halomicroarcula sp. GCM10025709]|uniref:hypothetical protein n=1 Tax=Halomicroarcula sp. GCM10025709 TaxID=3252669 RepID=UPI003621BADA